MPRRRRQKHTPSHLPTPTPTPATAEGIKDSKDPAPAPSNPTPSSENDPSPYLFNLPRELRDMIYHHLFTYTTLTIFENPRNPRPKEIHYLQYCAPRSVRDGVDCKNRLSAWLLTSKSMMEEALVQFYSRAACTAHNERNCPACRRGECIYNRASEPLKKPIRLLHLSLVQKFCITLKIAAEEEETGPGTKATFAIRADVDERFDRVDKLLKWLLANPDKHSAKILEFTTGLPELPHALERGERALDDVSWTVDLSYILSVKGSFPRVTFTIPPLLVGVGMYMRDLQAKAAMDLHMARRVYPLFLAELVRCAKALVEKRTEYGVLVSGWTIKDSYVQMESGDLMDGSEEGSFEDACAWRLDVKRDDRRMNEMVEKEPLRYCRTTWSEGSRWAPGPRLGYHWFGLVETGMEGGMTWLCKETGKRIGI